jgi:hypothetical protein
MDGKVIESSTFVRGVGEVRWRAVEQIHPSGGHDRLRLLWVEERDSIPLETLKVMLMEHDSRL